MRRRRPRHWQHRSGDAVHGDSAAGTLRAITRRPPQERRTVAVQLDPQLMDILACPSDDHAPLRAGTPDDPDADVLTCTVVRARLPGGGRHPGAAARRGHPAAAARLRAAPDACSTTRCSPTRGRWPRWTPAACCAPRPPRAPRSARRRTRPPRPASGSWPAHRPRALVLLRRPGASGPAADLLAAPARPGVPGAGGAVPTPTRAGSGRWTSWSRTPPTGTTRSWPRACSWRSAGAPRWCCPRPPTARWPRRGPAGRGWWSRASRCRPGSTCPARWPSG